MVEAHCSSQKPAFAELLTFPNGSNVDDVDEGWYAIYLVGESKHDVNDAET